MYVIETCPQCGGDLESMILTMDPPIPTRRCRKCGWYWQGKLVMPVRVPFHPVEEVYASEYDTAGNYHWIGTHSGKHTIKAEDGER